MPFPGSMVPAPVMASRQGMMDLAFQQVSDQARPVVQTVAGALTGKGSGLLTSITQSATGVAQGQIQQASQAAGQAMQIGTSESWAAGSSTGVIEGAGAPGSGGGLSQITSMAQSMMSGSMLGGSGGATSSLGSMAATAGSSLGSGAGGGMAGTAAAAAASALGGGGNAMSSQPGITPGQRPAAPQFTALPTIPSMPRLQDVAARLGALAGPAAPLVSKLLGSTAGGGAGDDAVMQPVSQFAGSIANDAPEAAPGL